MRITEATLCLKDVEQDGKTMKNIVHICAWEESPTEEDFSNLVKELWESEEFGLKGDDDYEMVTLQYSEEHHALFTFINGEISE